MSNSDRFDKYALWRKNWPPGLPTRTRFPFGKIPVADCLKKQVEQTPDRVAMNFYGKEVTFKEWDEQADRVATALADMGYNKGDGLLLYMHNSPQTCIAYIAAARLGLIIFTVDSGFKEYELEYEVNDSGARLIFVFDQNYRYVAPLRGRAGIKDVVVTSFHDYMPANPTLPLHPIMEPPKQTFPDTFEFLDLLEKYPPNPPRVDIEMDEEEVVPYTGGTTGLPKGTVHTHENTLRGGAFGYQIWAVGHDLRPCDSALIFGPLTHIGALSWGIWASCVHGRTMYILARYDTDTVMKAIEKYRVEYIPGTVTVCKAILEHPDFKQYDLSSVKLWMPGEWMIWVTAEFSKTFEEALGVPVVKIGYGMSEVCNVGPAGCRVGYEIPFKDKFLMGTVPPDEGVDIKIVDFDTREELPPGEKGEIAIKTPSRCKYYWNKPEETARDFTADGWFYSGDIGMLDEEGYIYWYGRKKYLISVSGFKISPGEVEMIGRNCPDIANIAVSGMPHPSKGEIPKAFVQLVPGSTKTAADIETWFRENIASYKVPTVEIWRELPLTAKGSVDMKQLVAHRDA